MKIPDKWKKVHKQPLRCPSPGTSTVGVETLHVDPPGGPVPETPEHGELMIKTINQMIERLDKTYCRQYSSILMSVEYVLGINSDWEVLLSRCMFNR